MDDDTKSEINLLTFNLILTAVYVISLIFSIILTYNDELIKMNKKPLFNLKKEKLFIFDNRILISILTFGFLFINIKIDTMVRKRHLDSKNYDLQVLAGTLTFISVIIVLYVSYKDYKSYNNSGSDVENPTL